MKNTKFGVQLVVYFTIVVLISLLISVAMMRTNTEKILKENAELTSEQTLNTAMDEFEKYLKALSLPTDLMTRKNEFKKIDEVHDEDTIQTLEDNMLAALKVTDNSERVIYATDSGIYIQAKLKVDENGKKTGEYIYETGVDKSDEVWYSDCIGLGNRNSVYSLITKPYVNDEDVAVIALSQNLKSSDVRVGTICMEVNVESLGQFIRSIDIMNTGFAVLVDTDGQMIIYDEDVPEINGNMNDLFDFDTLTTEAAEYAQSVLDETGETVYAKSSTDATINGNSYHITLIQDPITEWYLIGFLSDNETNSSLSAVVRKSNFTIALALVISILAAGLISMQITKELKKVNAVSTKMAGGDLTTRLDVKRKDEFGEMEHNFNTMGEDLCSLMNEVCEKSDTITDVAKQVSKGSEETKEVSNQVTQAINTVAVGATEQASSTQEATRKVEELAESLEASTNKVHSASGHSKDTKNLSKKGNDILEELNRKSDRAKENAKVSVTTMSEMLQALDKINYISDAIADITSQTNLLSLNASIEAARAGEAGKGFAVVADEIRKLADESNKSTEEIKAILAEIHTSSGQVDASLKETEEIQNEQQETISETQKVFNDIRESIESLEKEIEEIEILNENMNEVRADVVNKMNAISSVSETSAASAEEVYASAEQVNETMVNVAKNAEDLATIVKELNDTIHKFKF